MSCNFPEIHKKKFDEQDIGYDYSLEIYGVWICLIATLYAGDRNAVIPVQFSALWLLEFPCLI